MIFNFNPKEYCFSSAIPDNFVMTGFQGDVVTIRIFLNRDVSPIFSTDIAAYKGRASIYDLRGIIEGYMEKHGLAFATCTLKIQEDRNDYALGEFTIFYCNLLINMDCKQFLLSHFLYSENTRLVPRDMQFDLQYFVFPNESGASSTQFLVQAVDGSVASYSVQGNWVVPKELEFRYEDVNMDDLLASLPEGVNGKLLGVSFYRGKRTFSIFFTDETPSLSISFRNEFNVSDVLFVDAQTKRKLSFERATALCCGESSFYDDNTEVVYESETASLSPTLAQALTNALLSSFVRIVSHDFPNGTNVLITDVESELSDVPNATNRVKFNWKQVKKQRVMVGATPKRIFNNMYNNNFS